MIDNSAFLARDFIRNDPKLEVARDLLKEVVGDKQRKDGTLESDHSILACNLVDWFGSKQLEKIDPASQQGKELAEELRLQKAVTLLHDTLEESPRFHPPQAELDVIDAEYSKVDASREKRFLAQKYQNLLKTHLIAALEEKERNLAGGRELTQDEEREIANWSGKVFQGVLALTHATKVERSGKVDKARALDPIWRPIKSLDQAASTIGDILHFNREGAKDFNASEKLEELEKLRETTADIKTTSPELRLLDGLERNQRAASKALDVSRALSERNSDDPYHEFNKRCYNHFVQMYDLAHDGGQVAAATAVQSGFSIEDTLETAYTARGDERVKVNVPIVTHYVRDALSSPNHGGITDIAVLQDDPRKVTRFSMWEGDGAAEKKPDVQDEQPVKPDAAELCKAFVHRLEKIPGIKLITGTKVDSVREYIVNSDAGLPNNRDLDLLDLLAAAAEPRTKAIDKTYLLKIKAQREAAIPPKTGSGAEEEARSPTYHQDQQRARQEGQRFEEIHAALDGKLEQMPPVRRMATSYTSGLAMEEESPGAVQRA